MLSYAAYKNTRLPPIVNRPIIKLGGGFKLGKPVIGSVPLVQTIHIDGDRIVEKNISTSENAAINLDERAWNLFHGFVLRGLQEIQINPNDLKTLYSSVYSVNRDNTNISPIVNHLTKEVFGLDIASGGMVPFQVSVSQIPSHLGSAFALASAVVNKVPVTKLYNGYINRMARILSLVDDPNEVKDDIKGILRRHAAKAPRFLVVFNILFASNRTNVISAEIQFKKWSNMLFEALDAEIRLIKLNLENRLLKVNLASQREK
jgi:hypothetical protein